jgi:hypothetical protein
MDTERASRAMVLALPGVAVILVVLFAAPGYLSLPAPCSDSYRPSVHLETGQYCADTISLESPSPCVRYAPDPVGGVGPTVEATFFGFAFTANLSHPCITGSPVGVWMQSTVTEPNGTSSSFGVRGYPPYGGGNWTTPDLTAGFVWATEFNLTILVRG